jgi:hypothetical protein
LGRCIKKGEQRLSEDKKTIKIKKVDMETEKKILIGLITNKRFCLNVCPILNTEFLSASYSKRIADWSVDYFKRYNEPIGEHIQDVFNREETNLPEEESSLIKELLLHISMMFDEEDNSFNANYWTDKTLNYLKKKGLEKTIEGVNNNLSLNRIEEAERSLFSYNTVAKETSNVSSLIDIDTVVANVFDKSDTELFTPDGDMGKIIGPIRRRGLMGIFGASKISKTFCAFDVALEAANKGYKSLIVSVEMSKNECEERLLLQAFNRPYDEDKSLSLYATWDCLKNKENKCRRKDRVNKERYMIRRNREEIINEDYAPCDICRGKNNEYEIDFLDKWEERPVLTPDYAKNRLKKALKWQGLRNIRITAFPQFSATFSQVEQTLDYLQSVEDFQPDIVVIDYINILKPTAYTDKRVGIDSLWQEAKRCADTRNICIMSPIHSNRSGYNEVYLDMTHISESIGIAATCTNIIAIDTQKELQAHNCVRVHQIANRFDQFNPKDHVYVLQCLNHGYFKYDTWYYSYRDHLNFGGYESREQKSK